MSASGDEMSASNDLVDRDSLGGWPTPLVYQFPFQLWPAYIDLHWHWFWSSADRLDVIRPPAPVVGASVHVGPAVIDALAQALVADLLAEMTVREDKEELR